VDAEERPGSVIDEPYLRTDLAVCRGAVGAEWHSPRTAPTRNWAGSEGQIGEDGPGGAGHGREEAASTEGEGEG
jgi:hypothetical protein